LIFCEECGQRLAPRSATPTPPPAAPSEPGRPSSKSLSQRPLAPDLNFLPKADSPPTDDRVACPQCGSRNDRAVRFCVTCGHLLANVSGLRESTVPKRAGSAGPAVPIAAVAPLDLTPIAPAAVPRACPRCKSPSDGAGQFCRFCGQSFTDPVSPTEARPARSVSTPIAPSGAGGNMPMASILGDARDERANRAALVGGGTIPLVPPVTDRYRLVLVARDGSEGPSFPVAERTDIGRSEGDVVVADDGYVSPRHARITARNGAYYLRDLGSTNGVFVRIPFSSATSGEGAAEEPLTDQEIFLVGQQVLRFEIVKHADDGFGVASENGTLLFGTPAAPRYARISQRTVEGVSRDVFHMRKSEMVIGRESGDVVFTDDPFLSRRHAVVRAQDVTAAEPNGAAFVLADLGSSNGTFLRIRSEVRLRPGMHFRVGQQLFRFDTDRVTGAA
jgi:pSer/pThr/pTyr-binding forkhead associated (FHA) protein